MLVLIKETLLYGIFFVCFYSFISLWIGGYKKNKSKLPLSLYMLAASIFFALCILKYLDYYSLYNYIESFYYGLLLFTFPLLYIYIQSLVVKRWYHKKLLLHFIPSLIIGVIATYFYFKLNYSERIFYLNNYGNAPFLLSPEMKPVYYIFKITGYIYLTQGALYFLGILQLYKKYKIKIDDLYSDLAIKELKRLELINYVILLMDLTFIIAVNVIGLNHIWKNDLLTIIVSIFIILSIGLLGVLGVKQKNIYNADLTMIQQQSLSPTFLKKKLLDQFNKKKIFLKKDLNIWDVCLETHSNRTYVSNLINTEFGQNFNSFVNQYRIKEAKEMLNDKIFENCSLKCIAEKAGFNSLASFNRAFNKFENISPGKYRDNLQI